MNRKSFAVLAAALAVASAALYGTPAQADEIRRGQWHLDFLKIAEAQRITTGKGVTVAVIDTGVANHPDLAGSVLDGIDYTTRGANGRIDAVGHGTSMAGLVAAHGNNDSGALGIAPAAKILPIRVAKTKKVDMDLGEPIRYAITHGAKVINISIGGGVSAETISAIESAAESDVVVVAAAGNKPDSAGIDAPAFLDTVVAVGAIDRSGKKAELSATGPQLDLMAPGIDITTTANKREYSIEQNGTSDSAAIVSGAVALMRSKYPYMSAAEVVQRLEATAIDQGAPGVDDEYGHGIVNIVAALSGDAGPGPASSASPTSSATTPPLTSAATPQPEPASSNTPLIAGGVVVLVLIGGLVTFLVLRRRT